MEDMEKMKSKMATMKESDFVPVDDSYGNELCVYEKDFPGLAKAERGDEVVFMIRGAFKGEESGGGCCPVGEGSKKPEPKLRFYIWDAALMSGKSGGKEKEKGEGIKNYFKGKE